MDLRSFWTAPFPENSVAAVADTSAQDSSPDELDDIISRIQNGSFCSTPIVSSGETSLHGSSENLPVRRKPMPRKGHKKSRRGCYSCKRRKIKCSELRPHCENCEKAGITCEYPKPPERALVLASPSVPLQATPTLFSMDDMRFFHHFLAKAYPHLPIGADHTWTMEIPAIAHKYEYLMKAMLGHGASHLDLHTSDDLISQGIKHRIDAVKLLNQALSRPATSKEEYDARFATFMVLTFQSTCLRDGMIDFLTMLRGCVLNGNFDGDSYFSRLGYNTHLEVMDEKFSSLILTKLDTQTLSEAVTSLAQIEPLCETECEKRYHSILMDVATMGYTSPDKSYEAFVKLYNILGAIAHDDFQRLVDTGNPISQLLLSHFLAAHVLLRHVSIHEMMGHRAFTDPSPIYNVMLSWTSNIQSNLAPEFQRFNEWPLAFVTYWSKVLSKGMAREVENMKLLGR